MEIRDCEEYRSYLRAPKQGAWSDDELAAMLDYWLRAAESFLDKDCAFEEIDRACGSPGEFFGGLDWICDEAERRGHDPQLLWDAALLIDYRFDGKQITGEQIAHAFDRTALLTRRLCNPREGGIQQKGARFKPDPCPECRKTNVRVTSSPARVRYLACDDCGHKWKVRRSSDSM